MVAVVEQNSTGSVAIVAAERSDATLVATLLRNSGVDSTNLCFCDAQQANVGKKYAVVMCHRNREDEKDRVLPDSIEASRLIVLSDCVSESTVVNLLENGARHVFDIDESATLLQARLEAALRQHRSGSRATFTVDDFHFDIQKRKVSRAGQVVDLSPKEFEFASRIFSNVDKVVKNSELMTYVWSLPQHMDTRRIDTAACRVRKKLRLFNADGWVLKRIRCVGYRLSRVSQEP